MKNLLLATNIAIAILISSCSNTNSENNTVTKKDSIQTPVTKQVIQVAPDTVKAIKSEIQTTAPNKQNVQPASNTDTTKHIIHSHGSPNQRQVDSVKQYKTKLKFGNKK
jgi:hypothetical protein